MEPPAEKALWMFAPLLLVSSCIGRVLWTLGACQSVHQAVKLGRLVPRNVNWNEDWEGTNYSNGGIDCEAFGSGIPDDVP